MKLAQPEAREACRAPSKDVRVGDTFAGADAPALVSGLGSAIFDASGHDTLQDAAPSWLAESLAPTLLGPDGSPGRARALEVGSVVGGRYRLARFLARGGMGEVYEAFDGLVRERVALKLLLPGSWLGPGAMNELAREVRLARRITHPNVCRIYDLGLHGHVRRRYRPLPFLSMELIDGLALGERLRSGPLPAGEARAIARQLLLGLAAAHAAGVLHADFKSDNVMLRRRENGELEAVILDFGLARAFESGAASGGVLAGSADYMAPEQLLSDTLGPETDLFAFGVVLFEMLTGRLPFSLGSSPMASAMRRLQERPAVPSTMVEGLPRAIDELVLTCLRRERRDRYPDASAALQALEASGLGERPRQRLRSRRSPTSLKRLAPAAPGWPAAFKRWVGRAW